MKERIAKFKKKYGILRNFDLIAIFCVFSLAGTTDSLTVRPLLHTLLKPFPKFPAWGYVCAYIIMAVPLYQCFLLGYGFLLGQFKFFWQREKQFIKLLHRFFTKQFKNLIGLFRKQESEYV